MKFNAAQSFVSHGDKRTSSPPHLSPFAPRSEISIIVFPTPVFLSPSSARFLCRIAAEQKIFLLSPRLSSRPFSRPQPYPDGLEWIARPGASCGFLCWNGRVQGFFCLAYVQKTKGQHKGLRHQGVNGDSDLQGASSNSIISLARQVRAGPAACFSASFSSSSIDVPTVRL